MHERFAIHAAKRGPEVVKPVKDGFGVFVVFRGLDLFRVDIGLAHP